MIFTETIAARLKIKHLILIIIALVSISYIPAFHGEILNWDDKMYTIDNPYIKDFTIENIKNIFSEIHMGNYHPLTMLSLLTDYMISGFNPITYHISNLVLHIASTIILFLILLELFPNIIGAAAGALIFGVHPIHVESVAWISERKDVLYTFFFFFSLLQYILYCKSKKTIHYWYSIVLFTLSLLSKGQAVSLALTLPLFDLFFKRKLFEKKVILEKIPYFVLAVIFGLVAVNAQKESKAISDLPMIQNVVLAGYAYITYLIKIIIPNNLCAFYPYPSTEESQSSFYWLHFIAALAFIGTGIVFVFKNRIIAFVILLYSVNIVFLLKLIPVGNVIMADRYTYVPSIAYSVLIAYIFSFPRWINYIIYPIVLYIGLLITYTFNQAQIWKDSLTLWTDVISRYDNAAMAFYNRGNIYMENKEYEKAIFDYDKTIKVDNKYFSAYINRGACKAAMENHKGAAEDYGGAIRINPESTVGYINRAGAYAQMKEYDLSYKDYDSLLKLNPENINLYVLRGNLKNSALDYDGAIADYSKAIELNPQYEDAWTNRASAKKTKGDLSDAMNDYNKLLEINPKSDIAYNNRGNIKTQMNDFDGAIEEYSKAIELNNNNYLAWKNRGIIYHTQNKNTNALNDLKTSLSLNEDQPDIRLLIGQITGNYTKPNTNQSESNSSLEYVTLNNMGMEADSKGMLDLAIDMFKKSINIKNNYAETYYNLANTYGKKGLFNEAISNFNKAIKYNPVYFEAYSNRGIAKAQTGDIKGALDDFSKSININPQFSKTYLNRAITYLRTGQKDKACSDLKTAQTLGEQQAAIILSKECR